MADFQPDARLIADSVSPAGHRLTTIEVTLHRFVLSELNTHRVFSRNSASSRAIPVDRIMSRIADHPALPVRWPAERRGMQGGEALSDTVQQDARAIWLHARDAAVGYAEQLAYIGVHKSVVNRLLEPFMTTTVIVSATDWDGFWAQRCSPLAQPELNYAAEAMRDVYETSTPTRVENGGWHLPYVIDEDRQALPPRLLRHISAARCARVSYLTHDGRRDLAEDLELFERLVYADPPHASPLEHVAMAAEVDRPTGNFTGWVQLRHLVLDA